MPGVFGWLVAGWLIPCVEGGLSIAVVDFRFGGAVSLVDQLIPGLAGPALRVERQGRLVPGRAGFRAGQGFAFSWVGCRGSLFIVACFPGWGFGLCIRFRR